MTRGKYIVLEGPEGVGKTTQLQELARRLQAAGLPVRTLREPDSQSDLTARAIRQLTQDPRYPMNTRTEVLLYNAARAQSLEVIKQSVENGVVCVVDRNYLTTLAIQYYGRGDVPDYETINKIITFAVAGIEPDLCILLDAPVATLKQRLQGRYNGERFDNLDDAFLERVRAGYLWEAHQRKLPVVYATEEPSVVADNIWKLASAELAVRGEEVTPAKGLAAPTSVGQIIQDKKFSPPSPPPAVPVMPAPAQASPSILNDEDSVQRPHDVIQVVMEGISYLLAPEFTSSHVAGTIGRAMPADTMQADMPAESRYYMPGTLKGEAKHQYKQGMDLLFQTYDLMLEHLVSYITNNSAAPPRERSSAPWDGANRVQAMDVLRSVLPLGATAAISLSVTRDSMQNLIASLLSNDLPEARRLGESLQERGHAGTPVMMEDGNVPDGNDRVAAYRHETKKMLKALADEYLPESYAMASESISLVDFWPKNELLLVTDMLYEHSNLPLERLQAEVNSWPYERKTEVFKTYIGRRHSLRQRPGLALEKAHYSWDLISDYGSFLDMQRHLVAEDLNWQAPTPRYGYEVPRLIEEAGLTQQYEACFDISLRLHSYLYQSGLQQEAQYVTLLGHKMRWKAIYNAREAFFVLETPYVQPTTMTLVTRMREKLAEVHPLTAESITPASQA